MELSLRKKINTPGIVKEEGGQTIRQQLLSRALNKSLVKKFSCIDDCNENLMTEGNLQIEIPCFTPKQTRIMSFTPNRIRQPSIFIKKRKEISNQELTVRQLKEFFMQLNNLLLNRDKLSVKIIGQFKSIANGLLSGNFNHHGANIIGKLMQEILNCLGKQAKEVRISIMNKQRIAAIRQMLDASNSDQVLKIYENLFKVQQAFDKENSYLQTLKKLAVRDFTYLNQISITNEVGKWIQKSLIYLCKDADKKANKKIPINLTNESIRLYSQDTQHTIRLLKQYPLYVKNDQITASYILKAQKELKQIKNELSDSILLKFTQLISAAISFYKFHKRSRSKSQNRMKQSLRNAQQFLNLAQNIENAVPKFNENSPLIFKVQYNKLQQYAKLEEIKAVFSVDERPKVDIQEIKS